MIAPMLNTAIENRQEFIDSSRPVLQRLTINNLVALQERLLSVSKRSDSYSQSASYYAMTGRKGLWLYSTDDTFMVIAAHPNSDDHLLLFPPMGKEPANLLNQVVRDNRIFAEHIQLARMGGQDQLLLAWAEASGKFKTAPEELLDWKYPVHTISTQVLVERAGGKFREFRKGILRSQRDGLSAKPIQSPTDRASVLALVNAWAKNTVHEDYSKDDLVAPTRTIIDLMEKTNLPLHGLVVHKEEKPVGFMVWEETDPEAGVANSMCGMGVEGKGISEFIYLSMAEILAGRGFDYVCDGGSETEGLDQFKRKMNPVKSVPLQSAFSCSP